MPPVVGNGTVCRCLMELHRLCSRWRWCRNLGYGDPRPAGVLPKTELAGRHPSRRTIRDRHQFVRIGAAGLGSAAWRRAQPRSLVYSLPMRESGPVDKIVDELGNV